jgi:hypothetical protein
VQDESSTESEDTREFEMSEDNFGESSGDEESGVDSTISKKLEGSEDLSDSINNLYSAFYST